MAAFVHRTVDGPCHDVGGTHGDQLVATGTPIGLLGMPAGDGAYVPVTVGAALNRLTAEAHPILIEVHVLGTTAMATGTHARKVNSVDKPAALALRHGAHRAGRNRRPPSPRNLSIRRL